LDLRERNAYKILIRKPVGRDHLGDTDVDGGNINMHVKGNKCEDVDCIHLAPDKVQW
jgi:hypothetical protein